MKKETKKHVAIYQLCPPLVYCFLGWAILGGILFGIEKKIGPIFLNYEYAWEDSNKILYLFIGIAGLSCAGMIISGILYSKAVIKDAGKYKAFKQNNSYGEKPLFEMMMPKEVEIEKIRSKTVGHCAEAFAIKYELPLYNIRRIFIRGILIVIAVNAGIYGPVIKAAVSEKKLDSKCILQTCRGIDEPLKAEGFIPLVESEKDRLSDIKSSYHNNRIWTYRSYYRNPEFGLKNSLNVMVDREGTVRGLYMTLDYDREESCEENLKAFASYLEKARAGMKKVSAPGEFSAFLVPHMNDTFAEKFLDAGEHGNVSLRLDTNVKKELAFQDGQFICWIEE